MAGQGRGRGRSSGRGASPGGRGPSFADTGTPPPPPGRGCYHSGSYSGGRGRGSRGGPPPPPPHSTPPQSAGRGGRGSPWPPGSAGSSGGRGQPGHRGRGDDGSGGRGRGRSRPAAPPGAGFSSPGFRGSGAAAAAAIDEAAGGSSGGYLRGNAAVAEQDRQLLLVGRDAKAPRVWELRVHPGQRFGSEWLAAVARWAEVMAAQQQQNGHAAAGSGGGLQPPPPPPPRPGEPRVMHDDDYDDSSEYDGSQGSSSEAAGAQDAAQGGSGSGSDESEDDTCDLVSYLQRVSLSDAPGGGGSSSGAAAFRPAAVAAAATRNRRNAPARRRRSSSGSSSSSSSSSGSWATDSGDDGGTAADEAQQQQEQQQQEQSVLEASRSGSESDDEAEAALTAAEERELLCEPGLSCHEAAAAGQSQQQLQPPPPPPRERRQRRGERQRAAHEAREQQLLLVSLRLERQGLGDKEAGLLASWFEACRARLPQLAVAKLWLFNNSLREAGAASLASLIGPHLAELHLSHNSISTAGARALLGAVPVARAHGLKPLWLRMEWNLIEPAELRRFIDQECAGRGLVVDVAEELPAEQRTATDSSGRELNLRWTKPWKSVHVQMPWLSCQRSTPAEAALLHTAKAVWARAPAGPSASSGSRGGGVVAAAAVLQALPMVQPPPPPPKQASPTPPPPPPPRAAPPPPPPAAAAPAGPAAAGTSSAASASSGAAAEAAPAAAAVPAAPPPLYQDGPLMLFLDTSALLAMLGCSGAASSTAWTLRLLQSLAGAGRFGRSLAPEQQSFLVLPDTVLKQLDSLKAGDPGVGGPVRRFFDKDLDAAGPKGADFLTVLAAHEGEGLVVDRQAAVAGSASPSFDGPKGQRADLAIIEVALFFRHELLAAAAEAGGGGAGDAGEAQPVLLVTNDNGQLQLAKAHGLPAFKLAGASDFEAGLSGLIRGGAALTSRELRRLMAPAATAGLGASAPRSLQAEFDGAVACLGGLLEAYEDLAGLLGQLALGFQEEEDGAAGGGGDGGGGGRGGAAAVQQLAELRRLLEEHRHATPFEEGGGATAGGLSVLEAAMANVAALGRSLAAWQSRVASRHEPSRVLKWASSSGSSRRG